MFGKGVTGDSSKRSAQLGSYIAIYAICMVVAPIIASVWLGINIARKGARILLPPCGCSMVVPFCLFCVEIDIFLFGSVQYGWKLLKLAAMIVGLLVLFGYAITTAHRFSRSTLSP